jgi:hypothetical protein
MGQSDIVDVAILGSSNQSFLSEPIHNPMTGKEYRTHYAVRYATVGNPIVCIFASTEAYSATSPDLISSAISNVVTNAVFSLAKSFWSPNTPSSPEIEIPPSTDLNAHMTIDDPPRQILSILMAPPSPGGKSSLAAMTDNMGRVLILDVDLGAIIRIIKGVRDAQVAWVQQRIDADELGVEIKRTVLLLVIYTPRGTLEVFLMRNGPRILGMEIDRGMKLIPAMCGMLGGSYFQLNQEVPPLASCYLMSPSGDLRKLVIPSVYIQEYFV